MLLCTKGTSNTWILTLTEKLTLSSPYYLFELKSDVSNLAVYFIGTDISTHQQRYNQFTFVEGTTATLNPTGQWTYKVYEQSSSSNLNPINSTSLLETGIVKVTGTGQTYYANTGTDNTFYINE